VEAWKAVDREHHFTTLEGSGTAPDGYEGRPQTESRFPPRRPPPITRRVALAHVPRPTSAAAPPPPPPAPPRTARPPRRGDPAPPQRHPQPHPPPALRAYFSGSHAPNFIRVRVSPHDTVGQRSGGVGESGETPLSGRCGGRKGPLRWSQSEFFLGAVVLVRCAQNCLGASCNDTMLGPWSQEGEDIGRR